MLHIVSPLPPPRPRPSVARACQTTTNAGNESGDAYPARCEIMCGAQARIYDGLALHYSALLCEVCTVVCHSDGEGKRARRRNNKSATFTHSRFYYKAEYCTLSVQG